MSKAKTSILKGRPRIYWRTSTPCRSRRLPMPRFSACGLGDGPYAWETYVEDRVREEVTLRLRLVDGSYVGKFVLTRLEKGLKRFHNPNAEKTRNLFADCQEVDVTQSWGWHYFDRSKIKRTLDELISRRGGVHRSKAIVGRCAPTTSPC